MTAAVGREPLKLSAAAAAMRLWAYLLLHRHESLPRKHVAFTLFPDSAESEALAHVRRQLHVLQGLLPEAPDGVPWIVADRVSVRWNTDAAYWLDIEEFEVRCGARPRRPGEPVRRCTEARLERAIALYAGDLLSDYYDDWVLVERERLDRLHAEALVRLLALRASQSDIRGAASAADGLIDCDCLCEERYRLAMGLHYLAGDRGAALKAYGECERVLAEELDIEPLPDTMQMAEAIRESGSAEQIVGLLGADLPNGFDSSALLPRGVPSNLRAPLTSFVGRERELAAIAGLLATHRLVTLVGPGGSGKTRLALETAARALRRSEGHHAAPMPSANPPQYPDGVWWVDLASIDVPALVTHTVARAIGLSEEPGISLADTLAREVGPKSLLLVLDNAEHVAEACGALSESLLGLGTAVRVLATSREPLGVAGEMTWFVPPLSVPPEHDDDVVGDVSQFEAPALFLDRAHLCDPRFDLADVDAPVLAALCRRLEGIPLAVELAAAQVGTASISQIAERLDDRLRLLVGGGPAIHARHQDMREVIEWSHETLSPPEQVVLRRAAVFRGGWTVDAAVGVCAGDGIESEYIPVLLSSLVARSLVDSATKDGVRRHRMLGTTRQFAGDALVAAGEDDAVRARHLAHFLELAELAEPELRGPDQLEWLHRLAAEHDNFRAALRWALAREDRVVAALRIGGALRLYWYILGHLAEGRRWLAQALQQAGPDAPPDVRAKAYNASGILAYRQGDFDAARELYEDGLAAYRLAGDEHGAGLVLGNLGMVATDYGDLESGRSYFEQSLALLEQSGDDRGVANALGNLGTVASERGDLDAARLYFEQALVLERRMEDAWGIAGVLHSLGRLADEQGDPDEAMSMFDEALAMYRAIEVEASLAEVLADMGVVALSQDDVERAKRFLDEAIALCRDLGMERQLAGTLYCLGRACLREGQVREAERTLSECLELEVRLGNGQGIGRGIAAMGDIHEANGEPACAARLWGAAEAQRQELLGPATGGDGSGDGAAGDGAPGDGGSGYGGSDDDAPGLGSPDDHGRCVSAAKAELGETAFDEAWRSGQAMTSDQAVALALGKEHALAS